MHVNSSTQIIVGRFSQYQDAVLIHMLLRKAERLTRGTRQQRRVLNCTSGQIPADCAF